MDKRGSIRKLRGKESSVLGSATINLKAPQIPLSHTHARTHMGLPLLSSTLGTLCITDLLTFTTLHPLGKAAAKLPHRHVVGPIITSSRKTSITQGTDKNRLNSAILSFVLSSREHGVSIWKLIELIHLHTTSSPRHLQNFNPSATACLCTPTIGTHQPLGEYSTA